MYVIGKNSDFHLIKFPFLFPFSIVLYYILLKVQRHIWFFTLLLLAEPHFGATWPFLIYKIILQKF